jgi:PQQ-like domain
MKSDEGSMKTRMFQAARPAALLFAITVIVSLAASTREGLALEVVAPSGAVNRSLSDDGKIQAEYPPGATEQRAAALAATGGEAADPNVERVYSHDPETGRSVDPEGNVTGSADFSAGAAGASSLAASAAAERITIDRMSFGVTYSDTYSPTTGLVIFGPAKTYYLSDGTSWGSGAGSYYRPRAIFDHAEIVGATIRYYFNPPAEGFLYKQTDYDYGDHSSNGSLGPAGLLVLEATLGSSTATMSGDVSILSNVPANYTEPRFNYWSAPMGAIVPFRATFNLLSGATFTATTFATSFSFSNSGEVNFADPSSIPPLTGVEIFGSAQVRPGTTTAFHAVATYESGARENVTGEAVWSVTPSDVASIDAGELTTAEMGCAGVVLEIRATFTSNGSSETGTRSVQCRTLGSDEWSAYWETYQGDERHSGYVPISLEPEVFSQRWQRTVVPGATLNPVTAADGKVFVSIYGYFRGGDALFTLDARDGEVLWSRGFGTPFSVNPPAYGYGNVYIQTGNHGSDTWLWAFDANTGSTVFQSPHSAQWERYFAPTIYDGSVYVNGGYYGGMYAFDAFSGASQWFADLQQYDQFTPAVDEDHVFAYVGEYSPGLYVVDRETGRPSYTIPDPDFDWNGWSMNLAPVLGSLGDVIAIHDGRLIRFDLAGRRIAYQIQANFSGQPSVAKGVVYAINGGALEARNESDGAVRWRWVPPSGAATEHVIVTDTHALVRTATATYAIELLSGQSVWSIGVAGSMAIGDETLYIASANGVVTAISIPERLPAPPVKLEIEGPVEVQEFTTASYEAWVTYEDGRLRKRTDLTEWSVEPSEYATIDERGELAVPELLVPSQDVVVRALYREGDAQVADELDVSLGISVSLDGFVDRNAEAALAAKRRALAAIEEAQLHETAAIRVAEEQFQGASRPKNAARMILEGLRRAFFWGAVGHHAVEQGANELESVLETDSEQGSTAGALGRP